MLICTNRYKLLFFVLLLAGTISTSGSVYAQSLALYTPYTDISVPPGESIKYSVQVINNSGSIRKAALSMTGLPEGWEFDLKSGGDRKSVVSGKSVSVGVDLGGGRILTNKT